MMSMGTAGFFPDWLASAGAAGMAAIPGMWPLALGNLATSLLGGLFGGDTTTTETTSFELGELSPYEQDLYRRGMSNIAYGARSLRTEQGLPESLQLAALSGDPLAMFGLSAPGVAEMFLERPGEVTPEQAKAIEAAATTGYDVAADRWRAESEAAQRSAARSTQSAMDAMSGYLGGTGLLGSSVGSRRMATALGGITGGLQDLEARRASELGSLARTMQGQIGQMTLQYPLEERRQRLGMFASAILPAALQARQQQIGLRGQWGANMQALMSDPTMANLLQKMIATGTQTTVTEEEGGWF